MINYDEDRRAHQWGRAIRLAQRLSAGTEQVLRHTALSLEDGTIVLTVAVRHRALYAEAVERRLDQLGNAMGLPVEVAFN